MFDAQYTACSIDSTWGGGGGARRTAGRGSSGVGCVALFGLLGLTGLAVGDRAELAR